ncbi:unnamed protein product [Adineta ricciae]|uniref:UDP-glucuronosyltransferase n=1 Tax=Adineta ricciae TaxID=249248 RepID=A0A816EU61_ADIRI|nr:unnamed protein product [Adineta ricciae]
MKLYAPPSRLLFVSIPNYSHISALTSIARDLPSHHQISFAVFEENIQLIREKLESYRPVTIISMGHLSKSRKSYAKPDDESNLAFLHRVVFSNIVNDYKQIHNVLFDHLQKNSYDMMIVDMFVYAAQDLAYDLHIPMVIHSVSYLNEDLTLPSWIPRGIDTLTYQQLQNSFLKRFYNSIVMPLMMIYYLKSREYQLNQIQMELNRTVTRSTLGLCTQHWSRFPVIFYTSITLEFRYRYPPNYHFIGFLLENQTSDQIENEKESNLVNTYVTFGTLTVLHETIWKEIANTLDFVSQMRLLLVIPQQPIRIKIQSLLSSKINVLSRVLVVPWIEQKRVLTHHSVHLFITHGGLNSVGEAIYAHVPLIILPGFADQFTNAAKVEETKLGHFLYRNMVTSVGIVEKIKLIHDDYDQYVQRLRRFHQVSLFEGGAERAAQLIDEWLLTGYSHLITHEHELSYLIQNSLDIWLTLFAGFLLFIYLFFRIIKSIFCRQQSITKHKTD